ncbi:MAG TPA: hypothetical protein VK809_13310, partial [Bacteroidia bacterium]|nr:hypothetical protein [Bacteroidia bacterium]
MKRLLLIANKNWEVVPIMNALINQRFSPNKFVFMPNIYRSPWIYAQGTGLPRMIWNTFSNIQIELWCIQDLMDIADISDSELFSSSELKVSALKKAINFNSVKPDMVIALGTAAYGDATLNNNGCVVVGCDVFIHNFHPHEENPKSRWDDPTDFEKILKSSIGDNFFNVLDATAVNFINAGLLKPFLNPADNIQAIFNRN